MPNRKIVGEILHNFGHTRQLDVTITIPHNADLARVFGAATAALAADPRLLKDPSPVVGVSRVTDAGIKVSVQPWVRVTDFSAAEDTLYRALVERFRATGVTLPVSYHEVRMLNGGAVAK